MAVTVAMQVPVGSPLESYALPGGTYSPNTAGVVNVAQTDVAAALAAGLQFADLVQTVVPTATAAAGTTLGTAAALPTLAGNVYQVSGSNGTNGVILGAADAVVGRLIYISNTASAVMLVYPPNAASSINAGAAGAAFSTTSAKGCLLVCLTVSGTTSTWAAIG